MKNKNLPFVKKQTSRILLISMFASLFDASNSHVFANTELKSNETQSITQRGELHFAGEVLDNLGDPLPGASVEVKGKALGTTTDIDGKFSLKVPFEKSYTLVIRFVGMQPKEINVSASNTNMKIRLESDEQRIDEVVVTGYGTYKKSAYAGSASTVKTQNLKDIPATSFTEVLQGAAPGIQIASPSGQPGSSTSVNIRGMGSFNASNSPLYVIDGIPVMSGNFSSTGSSAGLDILSTINNSDIENITVIKDAAAASLYGSRAANGVILITTKQGKSGKPVINVKADWGFTDFAMDYRPVMDGQERRDMIYQGLINGAVINDKMSPEDAIKFADTNIDAYAPVPWCGFINWKDQLFRKGNHQNYEVSIAGGSDKFKFYASLAYMDQQGITLRSGLDRVSGRVNMDYNATQKLTIGAKVLFSHLNQDVNSEGTSYTSPFYSSINCVVPSDPVYNEDGTWNRNFIRNDDRNPLLSATYCYDREMVDRSFNTIYGQYEFIQGLKFKTTLSYDLTHVKGREWNDPRTSDGEDTNGSYEVTAYDYRKLVWTNALSYLKQINDKHNIDALIGYETDQYTRDYVSAENMNFAIPEKHAISNGVKVGGVDGSDTGYRMVSYVSKFNYDYDNKYYIGGSYRLDGSSRLHRDNRWGNFWSVSGAWRLMQEDFMSGLKPAVSDLKLRASYGVNGTLPSTYFGYYGLSSLREMYFEQPGIVQSQLRNDNLSWEKNYNFNIGVDAGFFDNRLNVTLEYYTRRTKDLLMDRPISLVTGFSSYLMNIGEVKNQGVELEIRSTNIETKDFVWNTNFNLGHNRNKIVRLDGIQTEIPDSYQIRKVGLPYRTFYLIEFAGINPETGVPQFYTNTKDENGNYIKDITENPDDAQYIPMKCADPKVLGGLNNTFRYKWFDLGFTLTYQFGGWAYDTWAQKTEHGGSDCEANIPIYYRDSWKNPGDKTNIEQFIFDRDISMASYRNSRRLHETDFIRLKNLTFGVTLPSAWTKKAGIENVRLYMSGNNLLTWAKHDYYDPEAVYEGTAIWGTPPLRTLTFGININL